MEDTAAKRLLLVYASLFSLLLLANGLYHPIIAPNTVLYWTIDLLTWIALPATALWHLYHKFQIQPLALLRFLNFNQDLEFKWIYLPFMILLSLILIATFRLSSLLLYFHSSPNIFEHYFSYADMIPTGATRRETVILYFALSAALLEETVYRAIPYHFIDSLRERPILYLLSTSLLFSLLHWEQNIWGLFRTFLYGLVFSTLYLKSRNIVLPITLHATINWFAFHSLTFRIIDDGIWYVFS